MGLEPAILTSHMKHKKGTVGREIEKLVTRYGNYTTGIYILQQALAKSLRADSSMRLKEEGWLGEPHLLVHELSRYREIEQQEREILARYARVQNQDTVQDSIPASGQKTAPAGTKQA